MYFISLYAYYCLKLCLNVQPFTFNGKDKFEINKVRLYVRIFKILSKFKSHNAQFVLTFIQHNDLP